MAKLRAHCAAAVSNRYNQPAAVPLRVRLQVLDMVKKRLHNFRFQFSLRALLALVTGVAVIVAMLNLPMARIDAETAARIRPGMTIEEAAAIIGVPEGNYDGVISMYTDRPLTKGYYPEWMGTKGVILLSLDLHERVAQCDFYPGRDVAHSWRVLAMERLTRQQGGELSLLWRLVACPVIVLLGLWIAGWPVARLKPDNTPVFHSTIGLLIGATAGTLLSWSVVSFSLEVVLSALVAAAFGAIMGLCIGQVRSIRTERFNLPTASH